MIIVIDSKTKKEYKVQGTVKQGLLFVEKVKEYIEDILEGGRDIKPQEREIIRAVLMDESAQYYILQGTDGEKLILNGLLFVTRFDVEKALSLTACEKILRWHRKMQLPSAV